MRFLTTLLALVLLPCAFASAEVVTKAPNFTFAGKAGKSASLNSLKGQPVILLISQKPKDRTFRKQVARLEELYRLYAARDVVFAAAFTEEPGPVKSDIPFVVVNDGFSTAGAYGSDGKFRLAVIGKDGNLDLITSEMTSAERINSVLNNSYVMQKAQRK